MRVALIGSGLQARRRLPVVAADDTCEVVAISSLRRSDAATLAEPQGIDVDEHWSATLARPHLDAVMICTTPDSHQEIARAALSAGKHVLIEKPMTQSAADARELSELSRTSGLVLRCGFNHRFHPAISRMLEIATTKELGDALAVRANYGIGGRLTLSQEWRGDPTRAAGGHLMEQGIHLFDLVQAIEPRIENVSARVDNLALDLQPLEDFGTAILSRSGFVASLTASLVQWRNTFSFELACVDGYVEVNGLGGSYGAETLTVGRRDENAPFSEVQTFFRGADPSWRLEWEHFRNMIEGDAPPEHGDDAVKAMSWVEAAYVSSSTGRSVQVGP